MTVASKNLTYGTSLDDAISTAFLWLKHARKKNIVNLKETIPLDIYQYAGDIDTSHLTSLSSFFIYSKKDDPMKDRMRVMLLQMMSGWLKSWFFMYDNAVLSCEPSIGFNINDNGMLEPYIIARYGTFYTYTHIKKNASNNQFPVIISHNDYKWFTPKKWSQLLNEKKPFDAYLHQNNINWQQGCHNLTHYRNIDDLLQLAFTIDVPFELKDKLKLSGMLWNPIIKTWFLPLGWDKESVFEYLEFLKNKKEA